MMEQDFNKEHWEQKKCPQYDCRKKQCECGLEKVFLSAALGDDSKDSPIAPKNGEYCNAIVVYEANGHIYIYSQEGIPTLVETEGSNVEEIIEQLERRLNQEVLDRQAADNVLQGEIDDIKNSPDVVDIVATYAALQAYDTSKLGDNDIVRVLQDETHDGQSTYYRWNKQSSSWTYIGAVGDYYTKGQVDTLLADKQDELTAGANITIDANNEISATDTTYSDFTGATIQQAGTSGLVPAPTTSDPDKYLKGDGSWGTPTGTTYTAGTNVSISSGNVISATDTTYSNFIGTDGQTAGSAGLVPAPATADADKFLKSDGTWATAGGGGGGVTVVQTTGTSTTDVMSQDATTKLVYPDIANSPYKMVIGEGSIAGTNKGLAINGVLNSGLTGSSIAIGTTDAGYAQIGTSGRADNSVAIGNGANVARGVQSVAIGGQAFANSGQNTGNNVAIGFNTNAGNNSATSTVALGAYARTSRTGEVNIGTGSNGSGYNNTNYRVLGGVHDGQLAQDAVTVNQVNATIDAINTALNTNIPHIGA